MSKNTYESYIKNLFTTEEEFQEFLECLDKPLEKSIKILESRIEINQAKKLFEKFGWELKSTVFKDLKDIFYVDRKDEKLALGKHFLHLLGFYYIQEVAASIPAHFVDIPENGLVLDMSGAPGGKSIQLCDKILKNKSNGMVWSNDLDYKRTQTLAENFDRTGMYNQLITNMDATQFGKILPETFDAVLLDAPCSGEGTSFKSDFAVKYRKEENICKIANLQQKLLESAFSTLKVGGTLVYSTCTINTIENEENVMKILKKYEGQLELEDIKLNGKSTGVSVEKWKAKGNGVPQGGNGKMLNEESPLEENEDENHSQFSTFNSKLLLRCWPHIQKTGGFFVAKMRKINPSVSYSPTSLPGGTSFHITFIKGVLNNLELDFSQELQNKVWNYIQSNYGIEKINDNYFFVEYKENIYVTSPKFLEISSLAKFQKIGVPILKIIKNGMIPLHEFGIILGHGVAKNFLNLTENQVWDYVNYKDLKLNDTLQTFDSDFIVLKWENKGIGVGKIIGNGVKNKFTRT